MIVCARCHHENPDGTLLCETCRTYLGWSATSAAPSPAVAPGDAEKDEPPPPATEEAAPPAAPPVPPATTRTPATAPPPAAPPVPPAATRAPVTPPAAPPPAARPPTGRTPLPAAPPSAPGTPAVAPGAPKAPAPITVRTSGGPGARQPVTPVAVPAAPSGRPAPVVPPPVPRAAPTTTPAPTGTGESAPPAPAADPAPATTPAQGTDPAPAAEPAPTAPAAPAHRPPTSVRPVPVVLTPSETRSDRAPAREAPERTIGVRVAAGEARIAPRAPTDPDHPTGTPTPPNAFDAVLPTEAGAYSGTPDERPPAAPTPVPDESWQSFEDAIRCPSCGRALPVSRRFCRCGATLVRAAAPEVDPEPPREPWYRRWLGGFRRGQGFWRRMRAANNGVRVRYDQARSAQVHLAEVTALLAALGITAVFVLPSTAQLETEVIEQVTALDPRGYSAITGVTATTDPPTPPEPGFDPSYAVDGTTGRAWAGVWTPPTDAGPKCRRPGGTAALVLTLPEPTHVDQIAFSAGMPESSPDRATQDLPHRVDVSWGDGADQCRMFELTDTSDLQPRDLDVPDVTTVRIVVVSVHETQDPPEVRHVAFNEVLLLQRGVPSIPEP